MIGSVIHRLCKLPQVINPDRPQLPHQEDTVGFLEMSCGLGEGDSHTALSAQ